MAESSLTGFILQQAFKSRKEAKAKKASQDKAAASGKKVDDKDRKGLFRKAFTKNLFGGLFGGRSATGGSGSSNTATGALLSRRKKKQKQSKGSKPSGGKAKGLEKILLTGFGSLAADTTAISGGLAALTEIMNSQLNVEGDMSSNIQGINAILADQLEVQTQLIGSLGGGLNVSNDQGDNSILPGGEKPKAAKDDSATAALLQRAQDMGAGAGLRSLLPLLFNPGTAAATALGAWSWLANQVTGVNQAAPIYMEQKQKELEGKTPIINPYTDIPSDEYQGPFRNERPTPGAPLPTGILKPASQGLVNYSTGGVNVDSKLINVQNKNQPKLYSNKTVNASSTGGNMLANFISLSTGGIIPSAIPQSSTAYPMAAGGSKAMIGEAGKEAVVPLHSADSPAKSKTGMDPSMQASAGSMLSVTDQFIKSMGALGGPVSQALGADISNLAKTFGMSQTLPNLSLGGGKFREDTSAKKGREKFVKDLIAGSLEALGGKKKQEPVSAGTPPPPPPDEKNPALKPDTPDGAKPPGSPDGGGKPMDPASNGNSIRPGGKNDAKAVDAAAANLTPNEARGITDNKPANRKGIPIEGYPDHYVLSNRANGDFEIWKRGLGGSELEIAGARKQKIILAADATTGKLKDPLSAAAFNAVRYDYMQNAPEMGMRLRYLTSQESAKAKLKRETTSANETGGTTIKSFQGGGGLDWLWKWLTTPVGQGASKPAVRGLQNSASSGQMGGLSKSLSDKRRMYEELGIAKPYEKGGTTVSSFKSSPAPKVSPSSYTPIATADTESTDIGAIVNIVGSQAQQPIPVMSNDKGQSTADYVASPMGGGLAFTVLSTSQWGG